jgi:hypothetical protein
MTSSPLLGDYVEIHLMANRYQSAAIDPPQQPQQQQPHLLQQDAQQRQQAEFERLRRSERKSPGRVTRVVADLMVFVVVEDEKRPVGLVFKPDKIADYHGEPLVEIGVVVGASIAEIVWNAETLKISTVTIQTRQSPQQFASA